MNTTAPTAHVEPQVHFIKRPVKRDGRAYHTGLEEAEPDQAHQGPTLPIIELGAARHERPQHVRLDLPLEHGEEAPLRGEEGSLRHR